MTHEIGTIGRTPVWRQRHFPSAGGLDRQDAKLMEALTVCRNVSNELLRRARQTQTADAELKAHHDRVVQGKAERVH